MGRRIKIVGSKGESQLWSGENSEVI